MHAAQDKVREAEFFLRLMKKHGNRYEFKYFLNAFLSALYSCKEHNRLQSSDPRFRQWYEEMREQHLQDPDLVLLGKLRDREIHQKGAVPTQRVNMSFPGGIETTRLVAEMDLSGDKPKGRYKSAEMGEFAEHAVERRWIWDVPDEPDVLDLCQKGLRTMQLIVESRDSMEFPD